MTVFGQPGRQVAAAYGVILPITALVALPLLWMVLTSFKIAPEMFTSPPRIIPSRLTLEWYAAVLFRSSAPLYLLNSLIVGLATTALCIGIGTLAAYGMTRFDYPGKSAFLIGTLVSYVFPTIVLFVPVFVTLNALDLVDTLVGIVVCHTIVTFPLALWMLRSFFVGIPRELDESAWVDGASFLYTFLHIILPLALPGVFSVAVFVFVMSWNEFLFASIIAVSNDVKTIPIGIAEFVTSYDIRWGDIMAIGTLTTVPVVVLFLSIQKFFIRGVLAGAVKG